MSVYDELRALNLEECQQCVASATVLSLRYRDEFGLTMNQQLILAAAIEQALVEQALRLLS